MIVERWWITRKSYLLSASDQSLGNYLSCHIHSVQTNFVYLHKASHTSLNKANQFQNLFIRYFSSVIFIALKEFETLFTSCWVPYYIFNRIDFKNNYILYCKQDYCHWGFDGFFKFIKYAMKRKGIQTKDNFAKQLKSIL